MVCYQIYYMSSFLIKNIKVSLQNALEKIPDFSQINYFEKGKIIDVAFKSILTDLMKQFGMQPGVDYVDNLRDNEPATDFVALSEEADKLIIGLMEGKIIAIQAHFRKNVGGEIYQVKAHFRKKAG